MSAITTASCLRAFDHVVELIQSAGPGRPEVDRLVAQLRRDGRGTEAFAAANLFRMADHIDHEKSDRPGPDDFDRARAFFARKLDGLAADRPAPEDRDGAARAIPPQGVSRLSPTLRALVELGQVLSISGRAGRIAHRVPEEGMRHIAALLVEMTGGDQTMDRGARDLLVYDLYDQGRGTEALAVRYFFNFIDHRGVSRLDAITVDEIESALDYSGLRLLKKKDVNRNGYSHAEIAKFSTTAKAFLAVGEMIEAGVIAPAALPGA